MCQIGSRLTARLDIYWNVYLLPLQFCRFLTVNEPEWEFVVFGSFEILLLKLTFMHMYVLPGHVRI